METIVGTIKKLIFQSQDSDYKIFLLKKRDKSIITVQGDFPELLIGARIEVHGKIIMHNKYGAGFKAHAFSFTHDHTSSGLFLYIQSIAKWIGPEKTKALIDKFGDQLENIIEKEPDRLLEVEGFGEASAKSLVQSWQENKSLKGVKIFLKELGLSDYKIKKIVEKYGPETENIVKSNPYILSSEGMNFSTCDSIARKLDIDLESPLRYKEFILYSLRECSQSGHLFLLPQDLLTCFNIYNTNTSFPFNNRNKINIDYIKPYIRELYKSGFIYIDENKIYDINQFFYENESSRLLHKIINVPSMCKFDKVNINSFIEEYQSKNKIELSDEQKDAVISFIKEKVMVITGGAGCGKTTTLKAIVQLMRVNNITFQLVTPTGIAAKKLAQTVGHEAYTIHRRLGYKGNKWDYNAQSKFTTQVVIVDETSMVDMEVFYRLVSALNYTTKLVFVGDHNQLPSVGPGNVLKELINCRVIKTVFLNNIFRQAALSEIIQASHKIKNGDTGLEYFKEDPKSDIYFIKSNRLEEIEKMIINIAKQLKEDPKVKENKQYFQIITPRNQGPLSVNTLNIALQNVLNPKDSNKPELRTINYILRKGDRILIKKNNYEYNIFNGDMGKIINISSGRILIDIDDFTGEKKRIDMPYVMADDMIRLGYAISCHKVQGQEYPLIIMPFCKVHGNNMLQRNLLYTAITRAKKKVIILGQSSAIQKAIINNKIQRRNTVFGERIKKWTQGEGTSMQKLFGNPEVFQNVNILKQLLSLESVTK